MALKPFVKPTDVHKAAKKGLRKVLYVEDEDINWETTVLNLRDSYILQRASNAKEAFERVANDHYDAILMDIQLSGSDLNGIEITQILKGKYTKPVPDYAREITTKTPVIFVSAYVARYSKKELIEKGGTDLIPKPVAFLDLSLAITRAITSGFR